MKFRYHEGNITALKENQVFCFGSNLRGAHGKGAALYAKKHFGARQGNYFGYTGNAYAIPTKDENLKVLDLFEILQYVSKFTEVTHYADIYQYHVTQIGCGLAGYEPKDIAPMFRWCNPDNTIFDIAWKEYLE